MSLTPDENQTAAPPLEVTCSRNFIQWLLGYNMSLGFTTYQTNRLFMLGLKRDRQLSVHERIFEGAMGLYATPDRFYMSSRHQIWRFDNVLGTDETYNGYDRLFVPRQAHTTGALDVHDIAVDKTGRLVFVNTLYSCLAVLSDTHSFKPIWKPPFISKLAPEDRCHMNGLAMVDGEPGYVTTVSRSDIVDGWRARREAGGCLIDVKSNEIISSDLSMPHSPRFYQGRVWLLNSGTGEFGFIDPDKGKFEPVAFCPGYLRGLTFVGHYALVGLSKPRRVKAFSGLELDRRLTEKDADARCGLMVIDINRGDIAHWVNLEGVVSELYDVVALPGVKRPMSLGFKTNEVDRIITIDSSGGEFDGAMEGVHVLAPTSEDQAPEAFHYHFKVNENMSVEQAMEYDQLSFPPLNERWYIKKPKKPITAIVAELDGDPVGTAMAEIGADNESAELISLHVHPEHRNRGIGARLLSSIQEVLEKQGINALDAKFKSDWPALTVFEHMLEKQGWTEPEDRFRIIRSDINRAAKRPWLYENELPDGFELFPWTELSENERQDILDRQALQPWYPQEVNPFQEPELLEPITSLGLRKDGRVIGWLVTHRLGPDNIQYSALFVSRDFRKHVQAKQLLAEAFKLQIASGVMYNTHKIDVNNERMLKFLDSFASDERAAGRQWAFEKYSYTLLGEPAEKTDEDTPAGSDAALPASDFQYRVMNNLSQKEAMKFEDYSFPRLSEQWYSRKVREPLMAVSADQDGSLVGMAIVEKMPDETRAELVSLLVDKNFRGRGIGGSLLKKVEEELASQGVRSVEYNYRSNWNNLAAIENMLAKHGWTEPVDRFLLASIGIEDAATRPWLDKYELPDGFEIFLWKDLSAAERRHILDRKEKEDWFPDEVTPFQEEGRMEPLNSVGLRHEGKVEGWLITHRTRPDTIQNSALFVSPEFQKHASAVVMVSKAWKLQIASGIPNINWMINVKNKRMIAFFDSMGPLEEQKSERYFHRHSYKVLNE